MATQWGRVRQSYMAGASYEELAKKYGLKVKTIQNRASKEGWVKEKGRIREEVGEKLRERVVRVRVQELEKLMEANGKVIDGLVEMANQIQSNPAMNLFDVNRTLRNAESIVKAIQTAVQTQRDLYKLPSLDQEMRKKEWAARKREAKARLELERQKWEAEMAEKAKEASTAGSTVWRLEELGEGDEADG